MATRRVVVVEEAEVDPVARTMVTYTRNLNLRFFMGTTERSVFEVCPDDPSVTLIRKEVWIESDFLGLRSAIKHFGVERYKKNCIKANEGFAWALDKIYGKNRSVTPAAKSPQSQDPSSASANRTDLKQSNMQLSS